MERKKAYYWCTCLQMITPIKVRRLIEEAGGPSEVFGQSDEKLVQMGFTAREQRIYHEACAMEKTIRRTWTVRTCEDALCSVRRPGNTL